MDSSPNPAGAAGSHHGDRRRGGQSPRAGHPAPLRGGVRRTRTPRSSCWPPPRSSPRPGSATPSCSTAWTPTTVEVLRVRNREDAIEAGREVFDVRGVRDRLLHDRRQPAPHLLGPRRHGARRGAPPPARRGDGGGRHQRRRRRLSRHMISMGESGGTPRRRLVQMAQGLGFAPDLLDRPALPPPRPHGAAAHRPLLQPRAARRRGRRGHRRDDRRRRRDHRPRLRRGHRGGRLGPALHRQPRRPPRPAGRHARAQGRFPDQRLPLRRQAAGGARPGGPRSRPPLSQTDRREPSREQLSGNLDR